MSEYERHIFNGLCPYTGEPCETFECDKCEVEAAERKFVKELAKERRESLEQKSITPKSFKGFVYAVSVGVNEDGSIEVDFYKSKLDREVDE